VNAADFGNGLVVDDTFKRQYELSGTDTGDDRKGTVEEASKARQMISKLIYFPSWRTMLSVHYFIQKDIV